MKKILNWLTIEESGQGMVEYSLILSLVVIIVIGAIITLGSKTLDLYQKSIAEMP